MKRRLTTLRQKNGYNTFAAYFEAIERDNEASQRISGPDDDQCVRILAQSEPLGSDGEEILPEMLSSGGRMKIWSAACSTGEEPYTLSMIVAELGALDRTSILATDLETIVLQKAAQGVYHERSVRDVPSAYLQKYFAKQDQRQLPIVGSIEENDHVQAAKFAS